MRLSVPLASRTIGIANGLRMEVFAITAQRRLQHPGVAAMTAKSEQASGVPGLMARAGTEFAIERPANPGATS